MTDALEMFRAARPASPALGGDIRTSGSSGLRDLAMTPGTPGYNSRIPKPVCHACGEDHWPNREYDHPWTPEPVAIHDEPVSATSVVRRPTVIDAPEPTVQTRVALYVGRGDTYVVAVEEAPDWDATTTFKVEPAMVLPLVQLARALHAKIADKTGGDLLMLEQDDVSQHAQDHARSAPSVRGGKPRRQGSESGGTQEGEPEGAA